MCAAPGGGPALPEALAPCLTDTYWTLLLSFPMEDRSLVAFQEDRRCLSGSLPMPVPSAMESIRPPSWAHRHLSRKNGLSKLCQSRMALSGMTQSSMGSLLALTSMGSHLPEVSPPHALTSSSTHLHRLAVQAGGHLVSHAYSLCPAIVPGTCGPPPPSW